jgi:hypothetical protein
MCFHNKFCSTRSFSLALLLAFSFLNGRSPQTAAQSTSASSGPREQSITVSHFGPGAVIPAELSKSVDTKKIKPGDKIEARTTMSLLSEGQIVIPANATITGHVTQVIPPTTDSPGAKIGIIFDGALMKGGRTVPFLAIIQAIGRRLPTVFATPMPGGSGGASVTNPNERAGVSQLTLKSEGVIGLAGLTLESSAKDSVFSSSSGNVHLDSGNQLILRVISN